MWEDRSRNIRICMENVLSKSGVTVSADSEQDEFGAYYLQNSQRSITWRSESGTSATIHYDLSALTEYDRLMNTLVLINHNLYQGTITITSADDADRDVIVHTETFDAREVIIPFGDMPFGFGGFGGYLLPGQIRQFFQDAMRICYLSANIYAPHLFIDLAEPESTGLSYIECAVMYGAMAFVPDYNIEWGMKLTPTNKTEIYEMKYGTKSVALGVKRRSVSFTPARVSDRDENWNWLRMNWMGLENPIVIDPEPEGRRDRREFYRLYGRIREPQGIDRAGYNSTQLTGAIVVDEEV